MSFLMPEMGEIVNRTSRTLVARFDGIDYELQPGSNTVLAVLIPFAKAQNVLMGSEDAVNPSDYISLVGILGKDDCSPLEQDQEQPTRVRLSEIVGEGVKIVKRGRSKRTAFEAAVPQGSGDNLGFITGQ